ncbi:MAG: hypothetical protein COZ49_03045 [Candidatus Yonathbacteria bacterium CG_4_10_14_3_um_filter_47_65]|uniref:Bacterial type II secretion system protein E domain-containing protein n=2 Tax=Parcubacteria group TaxID=1794811 RepID=A0A2M8D5Y2_9BACT|nr:MAG: hypothetical protein AUJ44_02770 [Candidatus Nomurabacteria bacterium CG1_02_47_685]PIP04014.1 MAG: hypothetical protein COX54_01425 [Candidatus Yonathbacteria bacterium CG23_combo_of_CG06-09_8_20_14_all_46_18]PIQ31230.1 MAG: hypothetical protein COW61_04165 [Candidatus Yonathbacteria bacterium CG17_big_fil_post_rev_8_21_14_2_50_46_19]PIX56256.1 MAG: hypothetical protein COZ49_03045 [Candidatus Yonathbacteria bacterium CG_4_10_14_3_um_filter_47_65]PIY57466.1 MAG: hypothetical protein CO
MNFLEALAQDGIIDKGDISTIFEEIQKLDTSLEESLKKRGVNPGELLEAKSRFLKMPIKKAGAEQIPFKILEYIPEESATYYELIPLAVTDGILEIGAVNPDNTGVRDAIRFVSSKVNMPVKVFLISRDDFDAVIKSYKGLTGEVTRALSELETEIKDTDSVELIKSKDDEKEKKEDSRIIEEAPVTKIVAVIIRHATEGNASDVHIEHMGEKIRVRFRVDGVLYTSLILPVSVHSAIVARVKILSNLKLDEKRKPQDGRFSARIDGRKIDFRVSTFPAYYGEKVVMRILDPEKGVKKLDEIGFAPAEIGFVRDAIARPYGMILITGPTGSGKSTTLYSMLNELSREKMNVVSLEDPVEYNIDGVSQSQMYPSIGYTFANGLRSILRQDPDVIMVGEIRDKETAQLAIQAALTGHLVFSTLHTNNSLGVIPRLIDMGVDPYLIAPTLILAIAQRLVRQMCPESKSPMPMNESIKIMIDHEFEDLPEKFKKEVPFGDNFYEAVPSAQCPGGTKGRMAVFEVLRVDKDIEKVILTNPTEPAIWKVAREKGMLTMKEDAIVKAFKGLIPFEEVNTL